MARPNLVRGHAWGTLATHGPARTRMLINVLIEMNVCIIFVGLLHAHVRCTPGQIAATQLIDKRYTNIALGISLH